MVIDGFNGLLVTPDAARLTGALRRVTDDAPLRQRLARNARATAEQAFSLARWRSQWRDVLAELTGPGGATP